METSDPMSYLTYVRFLVCKAAAAYLALCIAANSPVEFTIHGDCRQLGVLGCPVLLCSTLQAPNQIGTVVVSLQLHFNIHRVTAKLAKSHKVGEDLVLRGNAPQGTPRLATPYIVISYLGLTTRRHSPALGHCQELPRFLILARQTQAQHLVNEGEQSDIQPFMGK